jgi:hypothetical protein
MKGNLHVRFLEEWEGAIPPSYSAMTRIRADFSMANYLYNIIYKNPAHDMNPMQPQQRTKSQNQ